MSNTFHVGEFQKGQTVQNAAVSTDGTEHTKHNNSWVFKLETEIFVL
jgi:hypothetical protein